ncbi:MAG TPA: hypothetical protein VIG32_00490 [Candidatus Baltobacteraceae bacterium]
MLRQAQHDKCVVILSLSKHPPIDLTLPFVILSLSKDPLVILSLSKDPLVTLTLSKDPLVILSLSKGALVILSLSKGGEAVGEAGDLFGAAADEQGGVVYEIAADLDAVLGEEFREVGRREERDGAADGA